MIPTYLLLAIILCGALAIIGFLSLRLQREIKKNKPCALTSNNTDEIFIIQDTCFQSPHEAIALFDGDGLLILSNDLFKKQFLKTEEPDQQSNDHHPSIFDYFPEELWLLLQEGLSESQISNKKVERDFSLESNHYFFTFSSANRKMATWQEFSSSVKCSLPLAIPTAMYHQTI